MKEQVLKMIREIKSDGTIGEEAHLVFESILSSLDILQLISKLENQFGVRIPVEEVLPTNFDTVDAIVNMIDRLKK